MYAKRQLEKLQSLLNDLNNSAMADGCDAGLTVIDATALAAVMAEAAALANLNQQLVLGQHEHRHGESRYAFLVPAGAELTQAQFESLLTEEFEPEREEFLRIDTLDPVTVLDPQQPEN